MAMSMGSSRGPKAEINLTPMIDVLLVLIIMFLVITPVPSRGLDALVPQPSDGGNPASPPIVITVRGDGTFRLNQEALDFAALQRRLTQIFVRATNQAIFVRGDGDVDFAPVAQVIDMARGLGISHVALMSN